MLQIGLHKVDSCGIRQDLKDFECCHVGESAALAGSLFFSRLSLL